jgi:hypothetical protein
MSTLRISDSFEEEGKIREWRKGNWNTFKKGVGQF